MRRINRIGFISLLAASQSLCKCCSSCWSIAHILKTQGGESSTLYRTKGNNMIKTLIELFQQHPVWATTCIFGFNSAVSAFVSAFPAPTKDSSTSYVVWFKFSNTVIGNLGRAKSTALENSPNFEDAVEKHLAENGAPDIDRVNPPKP